MATRLRVCAPGEAATLLPGALAGDYALAPVPDAASARCLRPELPVTEADAGVVLATSGSTGSPKGVVLSAAAIQAAADAFRARYGAFTWTCALPTHHVAGLMVLARGLLDRPHGGLGVQMASPDLSGLNPAAARNAISLVPTQLVRALRNAELTASLARYDAVLVGGSAAPQQLLDRARTAGIAVLTSYGMTETSGGCVFDSRPLPGLRIDLDDQGRIWLGGAMVFSGYRCDPAATASALVNGFVRTNDRGEWAVGVDDQRRLRVLGRFDDVIITGGVNVDLADVQAVVDELGRAAAVVVGVPDREWGGRIVLATTDASADLGWWRDALRPKLAPTALPRQLVVLPRLPRTASGKLDLQRLRELAAARD